MKYWEVIADKLSATDWSRGYNSAVTQNGWFGFLDAGSERIGLKSDIRHLGGAVNNAFPGLFSSPLSDPWLRGNKPREKGKNT
jgi:hypothetical protein